MDLIQQTRITHSAVPKTLLSALLCAALLCGCDQETAQNSDTNKGPYRPYWELTKLERPISELTAVAKRSAEQRTAMKLAFETPSVRPKYAEAHHFLAAKLYEEALPILTDLATQGYADAQYDLFIFYDKNNRGQDNLKDDQKSLHWLQMAIDQGHPAAQASMADLYHNGKNLLVQLDWAKAAEWMTISAEQGRATAQRALGLWYKLGNGVEQDPIESYKWNQLALNRYENSVSAGVLTQIVENSQGYLIDHFNLTEEQVRQAEQRAAQWEKDHPWAYQSRDDLRNYSWEAPEDFPPPPAVEAKLSDENQ